MDIPRDLEASGQTDSTPEIWEGQFDGDKTVAVRVPLSPPGGQTEVSPSGRSIHQSVHGGRKSPGDLGIDLLVVQTG